MGLKFEWKIVFFFLEYSAKTWNCKYANVRIIYLKNDQKKKKLNLRAQTGPLLCL